MNEDYVIINTPKGDVKADILSLFEVGSEPNVRQYIALIPSRYLADDSEYEYKEIIIYRCGEQDGEDTLLYGIEDEAEYDEASRALAALLDEAERSGNE
ncbi:MAG TPA: hypothetical protein DEP65_01815 [Ruminococcus sp.]|nr:hypothetical protein [Ruminococcus sp.]